MAYAAPQFPQPQHGEGHGLQRAAAPGAPEQAAGRPRVLVVDDDAALAEMLGIVLRREGFEPVVRRRRATGRWTPFTAPALTSCCWT